MKLSNTFNKLFLYAWDLCDLAQTKEVVTEPLAGVLMTIPRNNGVKTKFKRSAQLSELKECVAPISTIPIKGVLLIKTCTSD
jgi:hypothetical protein